MTDDLIERTARAIAETVDPEDDVDIEECLLEGFNFITQDQCDRMVNASARAAITIIAPAVLDMAANAVYMDDFASAQAIIDLKAQFQTETQA